jgi:hypothetical protein
MDHELSTILNKYSKKHELQCSHGSDNSDCHRLGCNNMSLGRQRVSEEPAGPSIWRQVPLQKLCLSAELHGVTSQKTII